MIDGKLLTLLAVSELGSYTKAAEKLALTQPAVSQHIKQLENELDIKIFHRANNELKATEEGLILLKYARRSVALNDSMKQSLLDLKHRTRRLRVGITHTAESNAVAEVLGKFSLQNPGTTITIITDTIKNL
ncbi:MAG TPA: LysR family transcriptional regulator, partial [Oscillospiraceae bacterium]|nr:LysR family transcriptional regulator [Oscillospiraceae bacterium]